MKKELELYRQSFGEDPDFEELLFKNSPVTLQVDGETVSQLFLLPCNIKSGEALFSAYYVFALCTDEKHRKKGYMERLLNRVIRESDRPLILRPSNEKLIGYYEKFGFKSFMAQDCKDRGLSVEPVGSFIPLTESEGKTNEGEFTAMVLNCPTHLDRIYFPYSIP